MTIAAPERELLVACAVWDADEAALARVRAGAGAITDWTAWLRLVRMHRLVPHARRALADSSAAVPAHIARALESGARAIAAGALDRARQLAEVLRILESARIRALPFKGPALSLAAYGELGVRDSIDLDVVVQPGDATRAGAALRDAGYASRAGMSPAQERMLQRSFGHFSFARAGEPAPVELHWRFAASRYPWSLEPCDVLARAGGAVLAGMRIAIAGPTDEALLQAMHGARHQWERLEWLVAFRRLLLRPGVDEAALVERARANRSARALAVGLRLARDLLGAPLPRRLEEVAAGEATAARAGAIVRAVDAGESSTDQPYRFNVGMMDRPADRARYIALSVLAPTPREWELVRLPDWALPLYYPLRLARVLALRPIRLARALVPRPARAAGPVAGRSRAGRGPLTRR